ncbi:PaaI family thioesterase [Flavobacterium sp. RS13.1]|uniref:PaaI family thioesterase n=1 Tax=Flavobacterium sp. RS13.1 TaxID=3400345 RepID=UPI003AAF0D3A
MKNPRLESLKNYVGKTFEGSPSPFAHWLKGKVLAASESGVEFEFTVRKDMTNPVGMIHGGVMAGMIDDCIGVNFFVLGLEYFYPTINLNIEYFSGAREGEIIRVKTEVVKLGKTIINIRAEISNSEDRKLAFATSNLAVSTIKI